MHSLTTIISIIVVTVMVTSQYAVADKNDDDTLITVFADADFAGNAAIFYVRKRGCTSVPTNINDQITSISFNATNRIPNCVAAFTESNCLGTRFLFLDNVPCLNNLALPACNSDNTISSFRQCVKKDFQF